MKPKKRYSKKKLLKKDSLRRSLLPSPLIEPSDRRPLDVVAVQRSESFAIFRSLYGLLGLLFLLLRLRLSRSDSKERALRIRRYVEQQGGVWIKTGQLLAARTDILPQAYCDELGRLTDSASAFSSEIAQHVIEESLGGPIYQFFDVFEESPLAAASVGQVHRARLRQEQLWVAVKVKRPNIRFSFERDLALIRWLTQRLHKYEIASYMRWDEMYDELETMLTEELDYRLEASSGMRLRKILLSHNVYAPKVFLHYCTQDVLVTEFVDGVLMSEYIKVCTVDPVRAHDWCISNDIQPQRVAFRLFETIQRQIFEEQLFHADPHPGNIMLLRKNRIALIDFGSAGTIDGNLRELYTRQAAWQREGNYLKTTDATLQVESPLPPIDVETYTRKMAQLQRNKDFRTRAVTIPYQERTTSPLVKKMSQLTRQYKIPASWELMKILRTFTVMETSIMHLDPQENFRRFHLRYQRRAEKRALREGRGFSWLGNLQTVLEELPRLTRIASDNVYFNSIILRRRAKTLQSRIPQIISIILAILGATIGTLLLAGLSFFLHKGQVNSSVAYVGSTGDTVASLHRYVQSLNYADCIIWVLIAVLFFNVYRKLVKLRRTYF